VLRMVLRVVLRLVVLLVGMMHVLEVGRMQRGVVIRRLFEGDVRILCIPDIRSNRGPVPVAR